MPRSSMLGSHISLIPGIGSKECKNKKLNWGFVHSSGELTRSIGLSLKEGDVNSDSQRQVVDENARHSSDGVVHQTQSEHATLVSLNDADDEFFDVPEPSDSDELEKDGCLIVVTRSLRWAEPDPSTFLIRGANYLEDRQKVKAKGTLMQMVAANWVRSDKREDDLADDTEKCSKGWARVLLHFKHSGATTYNLALYYMMTTPVEDTPLLESFMKGDDTYRNSRFKLIPYISKLGVDIGLLTIARGVVSLVFGYFNHLVIEMAFLIQGNTQEELSEEFLSGTCRLNHLEF
ncbi:Protein ENHANCED DISEASE RESISTANCE [Arachis hypogaea]|nr:Protein ENHANCED DISEASE RESISTANCE [Arachis hypogaea]